MIVSDCLVKKEYKKYFMRTIRKPQNFFKHADKDCEDTIDFRPEVTKYFIFDVISKYQEITEEVVPYFVIFRGWFMAHHLDIFQCSKEQTDAFLDSLSRYKDDRVSYFSDMLAVSGILK